MVVVSTPLAKAKVNKLSYFLISVELRYSQSPYESMNDL
jgi:hypothetical protein